MAELKLGRLPDRTPIKLTISVAPDLKQALDENAALYEAAYGRPEPLAELVPHMLAAFLASDREFVRRRKPAAS